MESHFVPVIIIAASFSSFLVTCSYGTFLESAIDIEVIGNSIARSGVSQYTLFGNSSKLEYINCNVTHFTRKPINLTILRNSEVMHYDDVFGDVQIWTVSYKTSTDNGNSNGNYACRASFEIKNQSRYHVVKDVEVITDENTYLIASDVGSSVYKGEQISISCDGHYRPSEIDEVTDGSIEYGRLTPDYSDYDKTCQVSLIGSPLSTIDIDDVDPRIVTCDLRQFGQDLDPKFHAEPCSKPINLTLDVASQLNVSLYPLNFDRVSKKLSFVCTSDPPRLMYWTVLNTDHVNIMDIQNPSLPAIPATIYVNITQKPGKTSIVIQIVGEDDNTDNGIQTVICSTYDTNAHVIKTARRTQHSAFANQVGGGVITLMTVLSVFMIVLVIVVILLLRRLHQIGALSLKSPDGIVESDDKAPSETVLQDNPAYLPYTGTDDVTP